MSFSSPGVDPSASLRPVAGSPDQVIDALRRWLETAGLEPEPLIIETSGSTGQPKRVLLSRAAILASARATAARLGVEGRWILALPPSYVAGIQVIVRSLLAGSSPVVADLGREGDLASAMSQVETDRTSQQSRPRLISLVPTQLARLLDRGGVDLDALITMDAVLLGGAAIDPELRARAETHGIRVVATYGSSETAGGCVYDGTPLGGVLLDVDDSGRLRIGGPTLFEGYLDDPELTRETLRDGWFLTSDRAEIVDGKLRILGRLDDVIISGGVNVPGPAVESRLRDHPDVRDVVILGVDDAEWGQRVVAFVVGELDLAEARDWVAAAHPRAWAPRQVVRVAELPLLDAGKVDRVRLRGLA